MENENTSGSHISEDPFDNIVHLGAGRCSELDGYLAQAPVRLVLVEADPGLAATLKDRLSGKDGVEVIEQAISGLPGLRQFHRYNQPDLSSLHAPARALLELFPGLRTLEEIEVEAIAPEKLFETLNIEEGGNNRLVIDLPGEELSVLESLQKADYLCLFERIQFYCGREPLYEDGASADEVLRWLDNHGYDLISEDASHDPDRSLWNLKRNKFQIQVRQLQAQIVGLSADRDALKVRLGEQDRAIEKLSKAGEQGTTRIAALERQLAQAEESLEERKRQAAGYLEQLERIKAERDEQATTLTNREEQLEAHKKQIEQSKQRFKELEKQVDEVKRARDGQQKLATERQTQLDQLKLNLDKYKQLAEERAEQFGRLQSQMQELEIRNDLLMEEMAKAEGQVDLLKDVLLREPGI